MKKNKYQTCEVVMIGDSKVDYLAAKENGIEFILRRTIENLQKFKTFTGISFDTLN